MPTRTDVFVETLEDGDVLLILPGNLAIDRVWARDAYGVRLTRAQALDLDRQLRPIRYR